MKLKCTIIVRYAAHDQKEIHWKVSDVATQPLFFRMYIFLQFLNLEVCRWLTSYNHYLSFQLYTGKELMFIIPFCLKYQPALRETWVEKKNVQKKKSLLKRKWKSSIKEAKVNIPQLLGIPKANLILCGVEPGGRLTS